MQRTRALALLAASVAIVLSAQAQEPATSRFKDEMRMPWTRGSTDYIREWIVAGPLACKLEVDCLGGEGAVRPKVDDETRGPDGGTVKWRANRAWGDHVTVGGDGATPDKASYAFTTIRRAKAGKAVVSLGSDNGIRAWVNGKQVLARDVERAWSPDNDAIEVELNAGDNALLVKVASNAGLVARVLEPGAVPDRLKEITPSLVDAKDSSFTLVTDVSAIRAAADPVKIEVIGAGGAVVFEATAKRGERVNVDAAGWPEGPYEARFSTRNAWNRLYTTHIPWYRGDSLKLARELAADAQKADRKSGTGALIHMLSRMVEDRLGSPLDKATGNPWTAIHSPLMEYAELRLERDGKPGRVRAHGFVRLAWVDDIDDTPQFCRAYLPGGYAASKKWPLVLQLHGFNGENPDYWDWWSADNRHIGLETEYESHTGVIYIEPHGRGNTQYLTLGDRDIMRCMQEARALFSVDENRTYLTGDSMGGWGTWNVATRHPQLFAAIAPIFGGVDYHSQLSDEVAAKLTPAGRFLREKDSSWAMADGLINTPVFVHHGDADAAVNVEWSRWGVRLMQRWGYDIRYREYPGKIHEALQWNNGMMNIEWMLGHVRDPDPRKVRIRSAELRNAQAWWARVEQSARPLEFMLVDAEVMDRNLIRLDTENVVDIVLTPSAKLVDASQPVRVVWNGVAQDLRMKDGALRLTRADYKPAALRKTPALPGSTTDFFNTPFAVVIGTTSKDAELRTLIEGKARGFVDAWRDWQKFEPRVFKDTEISDADMARYSLILIGGADANAVTAKLAAKLPVKIAADRITIDGKAFAARDAALQMLYPHPRNTQRYVWLFAATSTAGMNYAAVSPFRAYEWDYKIDDGRIPAPRQIEPEESTKVVSGMFDQNWRFDAAYLEMGDEKIRANGRKLALAGKHVRLDAAVLDSYVGSYVMGNGRRVEITRKNEVLLATVATDELDLVPLDQSTFYGQKYNVWVTFEKDATGKVTGFVGHQPGDGDFEAAKQ